MTPVAIMRAALEQIARKPDMLLSGEMRVLAEDALEAAALPQHRPPVERCARDGCGMPREHVIHCPCLAYGCTHDSPSCHVFVEPSQPKCAPCGGTGRRVYGSTAGRRRGTAYQAAVEDDCGACNGTGRAKVAP